MGLVVTPLAKLIARAQARQEGWLVPTSRQFANRNPGNIMDLAHFNKTGKFRLNEFSSFAAGWDALAALIQRRLLNPKLTIYQFIAGQRDSNGKVIAGGYSGFAPLGHGDNDPRVYANNVAGFIKLTADQPASVDWLLVAKPTVVLPWYGATKSTDLTIDL